MDRDRSRPTLRAVLRLRKRQRKHVRGVALALVLAVLVCLLAVAIPFALSMRHEQGSVAFRSFDDDARRTAVSVRDLSIAHLGDTAPDRDPTPWSDGADETAVDLEQSGKSLAIDDVGPRGRLLSAEIEDQSGRIDLNRASLYLVARVLGLSSPLARKVGPDDKEIRLVDGSFLQDEGFLWIDGEITRYRRRDGSAVADLIRPAMVPGIWEPTVLPNLAPRDFEAGEEAIDFRAWIVAAWLFKSPASTPGQDGARRESRFETLSQPFAIAQFGVGALGPEQRARLDRFCTIWTADGGRDRFGQATRVFTPIVANETRELRVEAGHFIGRGTLFRLSTFDGKVEYGFVLRSRRQDDGFQLLLEVPLTIAADAYQSWIEFVQPRPVNVNACSRELLELLLTRLKPYGQMEVDEQMAAVVAEKMVAARPLAGLKALVDLLDTMVMKDKTLKPEQRDVILWNAEHSGAFPLEFASAPFSFASDGVFEVSAAASLNYPLNGREKARAFLRETIATAGAGRSVRTFTTQRDFDEPWRFTRLARGWTTLPENLQLWDPGLGSADPPSRLSAYATPRSRAPSEQMNEVAARLASGRMTIAQEQNDKTWHFDGSQGDLDSPDPDGWRFADGPLSFTVDGGQQGVVLVQSSAGALRPGPFGVSMWWNPGNNLGSEQTLFDWKANARALDPELHDRIRLRFVGSKLELEANDAFLRESAQDRYTSKIVYDFDDLPLEADTWYHVTAFCRGNRRGQMSLWVDGKPRGKSSHYSRIPSQFTSAGSGSSKLAVDVSRLADGTNPWPIPGTVRVGTAVYEYSAAGGAALTVTHDPDDKFGGPRPAPNLPPKGSQSSAPPSTSSVTHPAQSSAEVYGYSARLASEVPDGSANLAGEGLGKFGVVKVAGSSAKALIDITGTGGPAIPIGMGFEAAVNELDVCELDNNKISNSSKVLSKGGGYALLVSYFWGNRITAYDPVDKKNLDALDNHTTSKGSYLQGVEAISYAGFDGTKITGLRRGLAVANDLKDTDLFEASKNAVGFAVPTIYRFVEPHAFVLKPDPNFWRNLKIQEFVVLVVPISVAVSGSNVTDNFLVPQKQTGNDLAEMFQIDTGFNANGKDSTEWVRYDAIVKDQGGRWNFVRADPDHISNAQNGIEANARLTGQTNTITGDDAANRLSDIAMNPANYAYDSSSYRTLCDLINFEDVSNPINSNLAFRGVLETYDSEHSAGTKLYPVFRTLLGQGLPGRNDEITLIGTNNERPERHIINYGWPKPGVEDWSNHAHCALLAEVNNKFQLTQGLGINTSTTTGYLANATYQVESRNFARMLKFPSGELPSVWDGSSTLTIADGTGDGAKVDEVRIFAAEDPLPLFANGLYYLRRDVTVSEQARIELIHDGMRFPGGSSGQLAGLLGIHADACVMQVGDEVVIGGERTDGIPILQNIAEEGRTRFGDTPGFHEAGETAMVLPWPVMARLGNGISATDSLIPLQDGLQFPRNSFALIDREVIAYTDVTSKEGAAQLYVPGFLHEVDVIGSQERGRAAFRGRFGTLPSSHSADAIVFFWPWRYPDGYAERCDAPELASLELPIAARRALFHSLVWKDEQSDRLASLVATVRVQGRGGFAADPGIDPDFFVFEKPGTVAEPNLIDRQGDLLRVRFNVRYRDGALDALDFSRNSWKRAPKLTIVGVEYLADRVVEMHEESR